MRVNINKPMSAHLNSARMWAEFNAILDILTSTRDEVDVFGMLDTTAKPEYFEIKWTNDEIVVCEKGYTDPILSVKV